MSNLRKQYLECVLCDYQDRLEEEITPAAIAKAGWEDMGDGPVCPGCLQQMTLNWELLLQEKRENITLFTRNDS